MKKLLIILSSIIIINGAFSCSAAGSGENADYVSSHRVMRATVQTILKDTRFQYRDNLHWIKWILEKLSFLRNPAKTHIVKSNYPFINNIFKVISILMVIALPFLIIFLMNRFFIRDLYLKQPRVIARGSRGNTAAQLKRTAITMSNTGKYREAIHQLYLASLESLRHEGILPDAGRYSDKENLRTVKKRLGAEHAGYLAFSNLVMLFREKWYGMKPCQENDFLLADMYLNTLIESKEWN